MKPPFEKVQLITWGLTVFVSLLLAVNIAFILFASEPNLAEDYPAPGTTGRTEQQQAAGEAQAVGESGAQAETQTAGESGAQAETQTAGESSAQAEAQTAGESSAQAADESSAQTAGESSAQAADESSAQAAGESSAQAEAQAAGELQAQDGAATSTTADQRDGQADGGASIAQNKLASPEQNQIAQQQAASSLPSATVVAQLQRNRAKLGLEPDASENLRARPPASPQPAASPQPNRSATPAANAPARKPRAAAANTLTNALLQAGDNQLQVAFKGSGAFAIDKYFLLDQGKRHVIDLKGQWRQRINLAKQLKDHPDLADIRFGQHANHLRIVLEFRQARAQKAALETRQDGLWLTFARSL